MSEIKRETLEEFINSQPYYGTCTHEYKEGIAEGANWQAERMYSEEEVLKLLQKFNKQTLQLKKFKLGNNFNVKEWFEQFKKIK